MNSDELRKQLTLSEQAKYFVTLAHNEFLEMLLAGHVEEDYEEWTVFIARGLGELVLREA